MARFTLKQLLLTILIVAAASSLAARALRGDPLGLTAVTGVLTLVVFGLVFVALATFFWGIHILMRGGSAQQPTSPFATDRRPDQILPPSVPDAS